MTIVDDLIHLFSVVGRDTTDSLSIIVHMSTLSI
ncbi:MAG: hypothetical protein J07HQW2_00683 [Haloquadratum walsbyi J07HQW2]|uniref:Uncharacterized protein n=1 Tax=Haloquadratum walsbyi J07HQW2 TaxID=1238425 RepID=U1MV20_9EURY|nr:MAG: hypothetical protein J07HQW2_00683 [Haloquadratum walsbyi J07HQW2]